jgi:hypothetical protein
MARTEWPLVLGRAADIVREYDTAVTLRQLFYRLVAEGLIPNTLTKYKRLSELTADARRQGKFPSLLDRTRIIERAPSWASPEDAIRALRLQYRRDRTEGQDVSLYLAVEKQTLVGLLDDWFGDKGFPVLALRGYSSESYEREIVDDVHSNGQRPAVLVYAGDFDPSGEDILRNFKAKTGCFDEVVRVAVNPPQIAQYDLPPMPGKASDSRATGFVAKHGELIQVEVEALPPNTLRDLFEAAVQRFWDMSTFEDVLAVENDERARLMLSEEE